LEKQFKELLERGQLEFPDIPSHPVELDRTWWETLQQDLETLVIRYLLEMRVQELFPHTSPILEMFWTLSRFVKGFLLDDNTYRVILEHNRPQRLKIHCLDPSGPIGSILNRSPAMVGLSATLQPVEFFQTVLGLKNDGTEILEFPSPFPSENRLLLVIGNVSTRYRYREQFTTAIGDIISQIVTIKKGNYLLFFPSYRFMRSVAQHVISPEYQRIIQEPGLTEDQRVETMESLKGDQPILMFTVQGGIFSEGIDYPSQSIIGGIVIGPGLPQVSVEVEMLREYYDLTRSQGFEFAYLYPGMSRVIQSAGRIIRDPKHRGIIVLIGEQFTQSPYKDLFPKDWYDHDPSELIATDWEQAITEFWSGKGKL
jgi:DNA excision repair protein ERCC-2